jgi:hypothetical protein
MSLREKDVERALSVLDGERRRSRKRPKQKRCGSCWYLYDLDELHPDYDDEGRQIGLVCDSCI